MKAPAKSALFAAAFLYLGLVGAAVAQTTGQIEGRILGSDREPLPDVEATASSRELQGLRIAKTDRNGRFRFTALPPGVYTVRVVHQGFNSIEIADLKVSLDRTVTLLLTMTETFGEEVTVTGEAPVVDVTSTATGTVFAEGLFAELPVARTFEGLTVAAPGVTDSGWAVRTYNKENPSIRGASAGENRYLIDGVDITDPTWGILSSSLAFELVREVDVKTGGYEAEYGGALGGVLNVVTKSGGNTFHGDLFGYFSDAGLQASSPTTEEHGRWLGNTEYDLGVDLGGKLIEDRLWYFVALAPGDREDDLENRQEIAGTVDSERTYYAGKLTWHSAPSHQLVATAFGERRSSEEVELNAAGWMGEDVDYEALSLSASYAASLSRRSFLELAAGRYEQEGLDFEPFDEASPAYWDGTGTGSWARLQGCGDPALLAGGSVSFAAGCLGGRNTVRGMPRRDQLRGSLSWFAGGHELKAGTAYREATTRQAFRRPAPFAGPLVDESGRVVDPDGLAGAGFGLSPGSYTLIAIDADSRGTTEEIALFLQDVWRPTPRLTLTLGLRLDSMEATGERSGEGPSQRLEFGLGEMLAPRVGVVWDASGEGRSRLFASFARYFESVPLLTTVSAFGADQVNIHGFLYPSDGTLPSYTNLGSHLWSFTVGTGYAADPGTDPMHSDEVMVGIDHELKADLAVGVRGVYRRLRDVVETISVDQGSTFFLTNPGGSYTANPVTGQPLPAAVVFPEGEREYRALEATLDKRRRNRWQLFASYVYSKLEGNYEGTFARHTDQLGHDTWAFDTPQSMVGADGLLPNDRKHQVKAYGSYRWPFDLVTGFLGRYASGRPVDKLGSHPLYGPGLRFVVPRGSAGRTPDVWSLDLHIQYPLKLGEGLELLLLADVFNATDEQAATGVEELWTFAAAEPPIDPGECGGPGTGPGTDCPLGNPLWRTPTEFQPPRTVRLGLKLSW